MTILGTILATTFLAFIWFLFGSRETRVENSIEKKKDEMKNTDSENLLISNSQTSISKMNILHTANSWKLNEISSTQDTNINSLMVENSLDIQELQSTKNSIITEKTNDPITRLDTRNKSTYFSARIPSENYLPSIDCPVMLKNLENPLIDVCSSAVSIKDDDDSSNIISLSSLETGITVTDMTAEVPNVLNSVPVIELSSLIESISSVEDKIGAIENNDPILQSETATNASFKIDLKTKYSITKLRSSDNTAFSDTDTHGDTTMRTDSISDYMLDEKISIQ